MEGAGDNALGGVETCFSAGMLCVVDPIARAFVEPFWSGNGVFGPWSVAIGPGDGGENVGCSFPSGRGAICEASNLVVPELERALSVSSHV